MKKVSVCVYCLAYNHEKYIRKTLDGFINQTTNFKYTCIVHDDASTDNTANIIREYEARYPDIIIGVYQKENKYSKNINVIKEFIAPLIDSEYVAVCEGDDYWTDEKKLQIQYDTMKKNKNCFFCVHKTKEVFEDEFPTGTFYPSKDIKEGFLGIESLLEGGYSFHTSSYMFEANLWKEYTISPPLFRQLCDVGDVPYMLYFIYAGDVFFIDKEMSCYRRGAKSSWSFKRAKLKEKAFLNDLKSHSKKIFDTYEEYNKYTNFKYDAIIKSRNANYILQYLTLSLKCRDLFSKNFYVYFQYLNYSRKIFTLMSIIFPRLMRYLYMKRIRMLNKQKM